MSEALFSNLDSAAAVPNADEPIVTAATPEPVLAEALAATSAAVVVGGHVHMQFDRRVGERRWINAGSVGMPCAARPGAYWALLGPEVSLRRTEYDVEAAAAAIRATSHPMREDMAAGVVRPPTEEEAIDVFERQAGRRWRTTTANARTSTRTPAWLRCCLSPEEH